LSTDEVEDVSVAKSCTHFGRNASIFHYGQFPRGVYCVHSGHVKLTRPGNDGREQILRFAGAGDMVGYASMISGEPYSMNCTAVEESSVCFVPSEILFRIVRENPQMALRVMQDLSHELEDAERRVVEIAQKSVRERVAEALLVLKETFGLEQDGETLNSPLTREEIASIVGTAPESVIRTLSEFKADKLIETSGRSIRLKNVKGLIKTANIND
jgi:CRP/FNR family transcriptional regulator